MMGYDDFDSGDDDLSVMLTMDEMDAEDRRMDSEGYHGGGCLSSTMLFITIPIVLALTLIRLIK